MQRDKLNIWVGIVLLAVAGIGHATPPTFANYPLFEAGASGVQPNIMFVLDDSGSMSWDYLPDEATLYSDGLTTIRYDSLTSQQILFRNPQYNGLAYNPAVTYLPPYYLNANGTPNTTRYPSMTGTSATTGASMTASLPNWQAVPADGYGVQALAGASYVSSGATGLDNTCIDGSANKTTCNLQSTNTTVSPAVPYAVSYQFAPGEYCSDAHQKFCIPQFGPSASYPVPSYLRWCTQAMGSAGTPNCQALFDNTGSLPGGNLYTYPRVPGIATGTGYQATVTVAGCSNCSASAATLTVNGTTKTFNISGVSGETSNSLMATALYRGLPQAIPGLGVSNLSGNSFYIYFPGNTQNSQLPSLSVTSSGVSVSISSWTTTANAVLGSNTPTYISSTTLTYAEASSRTDCANPNYCTYQEEMTNYSNWWAYYRTRLQMMKTAASNAFEPIGSQFRVGFFTISTSSFLNPASFSLTNKKTWYDNLFSLNAPLANDTPTRGAIARMGQFYAGKHNGETWAGVTVTDPMQYSCQQNYTILGTDGEWNAESTGQLYSPATYGPFQLDNATLVSEQDGGPGTGAGQEEPPQYDGQYNTYSQMTSQTMQSSTTVTQTNSWIEQDQTRYVQPYWNLQFTVDTWGYVQTTKSYTQTQTPFTYTKVTTPYTYTQVSTPYTYTQVSTPYTYTKVTTPYTYTQVSTPYTYTKATTPYTYTQVSTPYTYTKATTPYTYTQTSTTTTYTQTVYTGVAHTTYAYIVDGTGYSGMPYCPTGVTCTATTTYPSYTSSTSTVTSCTASGSVGQSTYTTCSAPVVGTPVVTTGLSSCTASSGNPVISCALVAGSTTTLTGQTSCTATSSPFTPSNPKVTCTQVNGTATTTTGLPSCTTSSGNPTVTCTLVAGSTTTLTGQTSCTATSSPFTPSNPKVTCTQVNGTATTTTGLPSCTTSSGNPTVTCTSVAGTASTLTGQTSCTATSSPFTPSNPQVTCTQVNGTATTTTGLTSCTTSSGNPTVTCTKVNGTATTTTGLPSCTTSSGNPTVTCTSVAGTASTLTGQTSCTATSSPFTPSNPQVTCTQVNGTATVSTVSSCTAGTSGNVTTTCSSQNVSTVNITSGVCTNVTTASAAITCSTLQKIMSLEQTAQSTCPNTGTVGTTASSAGQITCAPSYVAGNASPYLVTGCTSPAGNFTSTPTYGTGSGQSTSPVAYGTCTTTMTDAVVSACTPSGTGVLPVVTCSTHQVQTTPQSCTPGTYSVATYTNAGQTVTGGTGTITCSQSTTTPVAAPSCTPGYSAATGVTTNCNLVQTPGGNSLLQCVSQAPSASNNYQTVTCTPTFTGGSVNSLSDVAEYYYRTDLRSPANNNCSGSLAADGTTNDVCLDNVLTSPGDSRQQQHMDTYAIGLGTSGQMLYNFNYTDSGTLGDYNDIAQQNVAQAGSATSGTVCPWISPAPPLTPKASASSPNICSWPLPAVVNGVTVGNTLTAIDDLWHTAVDGRGKYYSAGNATILSESFAGALAAISAKSGSGSSSTPSNLTPTPGNNFDYVPSFETEFWTGDLQARTIDLTTGNISSGVNASGQSICGQQNSGCLWSAQTILDTQNGTAGASTTATSGGFVIAGINSRTILLEPSSGSNFMRHFNFASLNTTEQAYFTSGITTNGNLSGMVTTSQPVSSVAASLINYLAGDKTNEGLGKFRARQHVLGDIVDSAPVFVSNATYSYTDSGYSAFASSIASRNGMIYVGANDGMLHAFDAATGKENWAFVPAAMLPQMYHLADPAYSHQFFMDGTITVSDAYFQGPGQSSPSWHTVLVSGYGNGGSGYFALDVTDPTVTPTFLWSVSSSTPGFENIGLSFGNPVITKLPGATDSQTWVVLFSSGYNNIVNGDGQGHLFAVDIASGAIQAGFPLDTQTGSTVNPSNLGKITAWAQNPSQDNTTFFVYAGDMDGNVWRFDLGTSQTATSTQSICTGVGSILGCTTGQSVLALATLEDPSGNPQPITSHIEVTTLQGLYRIIYVGTGSYLTTADPANTQQQTIYAIEDQLLPSQQTIVSPRSATNASGAVLFEPRYFAQDTMTLSDGTTQTGRVLCLTAGCSSSSSSVPATLVNWQTQLGWYIDLPDSGERVNVDMGLVLGTLMIQSNVPAPSACQVGGYGYFNFLSFDQGLAIPSLQVGSTTQMPFASIKINNALIVGATTIELPDHTLATELQLSNGSTVTQQPATVTAPFQSKLNSWRDIEGY
jgi:type IV pilus assembly protein PilY1